ncbi:hypothetical protein Syun_017638 [Stephania yunnanensis]|uniref:Cytochrome P450 n=1 Tax=Stephania yunnanensis TaxID=152371 RepID=A0AAP0J7E8_9MAGN
MEKDDMIAILWVRLEMIFRGTDTTALLTEWVMAELVLNQDIQGKLQKELDDVVGSEKLRCLTLSSYRTLASRGEGDSSRPPTRSPLVLGSLVNFRPERFVESDGGANVDVRGGDLRLAPFGAGRRVCPGKNLGLATVNLWVAKLVQNFKWVADQEHSVDFSEVLKLFSYFTAGSGGAGPTILATSFLLLGEEVVAYAKGEKIKLKPYTGMLNIDFGKGIGKRDVYLLHLPEVRSAYEVLGVPTVSARFGTAPFFWNWGMAILTSLVPAEWIPASNEISNQITITVVMKFAGRLELSHPCNCCKEFLRDKKKVRQLVGVFDPLVRAVDGIAGERVSMRVDLEFSNGRSTVGIFSHKRLSESVGIATASFALAVLEGSTEPGVWFPEEPQGIAIEARDLLLDRASQGTINFVMNKAPWMVETNPKELGLGIYF